MRAGRPVAPRAHSPAFAEPRITKAMGPPSKRGPTPFLTFFMEFRKQHALPFAEGSRAAGAEWRSLSDAAKQVRRPSTSEVACR